MNEEIKKLYIEQGEQGRLIFEIEKEITDISRCIITMRKYEINPDEINKMDNILKDKELYLNIIKSQSNKTQDRINEIQSCCEHNMRMVMMGGHKDLYKCDKCGLHVSY